ncbi:MAG: ABC transporter substrate-binding protein [Actinomycetota bacterium]|nr:ABC transporter substrate-binding protein [Actinomycetota bacterium]MDQ2957026.1 ABC transporter substrate-binding protein [Actinomycetota bacterium]
MRRSVVLVLGLTTVASLGLAGCAKNTPKNVSPTSTASVGAVSKDQAAADLLPPSVKSAGKLIVGINVPYAPNEYKDPSGKIIGWEVDFLNAVATKLGVTATYQESGFDNIIPSVKGGKYTLGMSSFTDNKTREAQVDFVNYYSAGFQWAAPAGKTVDPNNACGLKVAVQSTTTEETVDLPAKSKACTAAGKKAITIIKIDSQDAVNQAVILGQADAFDADSPITQYAVKQSSGKLQLSGDIYGAAPYGLAVAKDGGTLKEALQKAVQSMIDDGTYKQILEKWGVQAGAIPQATVNGAQS